MAKILDQIDAKDRHPLGHGTGLTLANKITIGRIFLIPVFIGAMMAYDARQDWLRWFAFGIYLLAGILDVVDGYVARHFNQITRAGSILDPLADKFLFISAMVCLYRAGINQNWLVRLPLELVVVFVSREIILIAGGLLIELKGRALSGRGALVELRPNVLGKMTAFLQVLCVSMFFLQWATASIFCWVALVAVVASGMIYFKEGIRVLNGLGR